MIYTVSFVVGLILGISYLLFKYVSFNDIVGPNDLINMLPEKANYLGAVPFYKKKMKILSDCGNRFFKV